MSGNHDTPAAVAYPAMRELLRQCVVEAKADVSFVALAYPAAVGDHRTLAITSVYPADEQSVNLIKPWTRQAVSQSIEAGHTQILSGRVVRRGDRRACTGLLVVTPMRTTNGYVWGAVAVLSIQPSVSGDSIATVERCARALSDLLVKSDVTTDGHEPLDDSLPLVPASHTLVHSGPRDDFLVHELRVPLGAAAYALDALLDQQETRWAPDDERLLRIALSGVVEAQNITSAAAQWPSLGEGVIIPDFAPVSLAETLHRALTLLPKARARMQYSFDQHLPPVLGVEHWLARVFVNLLENAIKYSSPGSAICVSAEQVDEAFVLISVCSSGKGLPLDHSRAERMIIRDDVPRDASSRGMGLSIARYFVTRMGGEIWMDSDDPDASTVAVTLPIAQMPVPELHDTFEHEEREA